MTPGYRRLAAGDAFWRRSNQMGVLNTDLAKQLEASALGARLWRLEPGQASTRHRHREQAGALPAARGHRKDPGRRRAAHPGTARCAPRRARVGPPGLQRHRCRRAVAGGRSAARAREHARDDRGAARGALPRRPEGDAARAQLGRRGQFGRRDHRVGTDQEHRLRRRDQTVRGVGTERAAWSPELECAEHPDPEVARVAARLDAPGALRSRLRGGCWSLAQGVSCGLTWVLLCTRRWHGRAGAVAARGANTGFGGVVTIAAKPALAFGFPALSEDEAGARRRLGNAASVATISV